MTDRIVAAAAGMAAALYIMAASVAWIRVVFPVPTPSLGKRVILDRAIAWSALAAIFVVVVSVKMTDLDWMDPVVDIVLTAACLTIFVAGLMSVRAITMPMHGNRVLAVFAAVSIAVGLLILLA